MRAQNVIVRMLAVFTSFITFEMTLIVSDIVVRTLRKRKEFEFLTDEMVRSGCRNWLMDGPNLIRVIEPQDANVDWKLISISDNLLLIFLLMTVPCLTSIYYLMDCELTCWRLELQNQIDLISEITRIQLIASRLKQKELASNSGPQPYDTKGRRQTLYGFDPIGENRDNSVISEHFEYTMRFREIFLEHNKLGLLVFKSIPCRRYDGDVAKQHHRTVLNGQIGLQQVVIDMMSEVELTSNGYLILMEKMYISFRLFMEHVRHCSDTTPPLTFVTHFLSYGLVIITVWHSNLIQKFNYEHLLIVISSCSWSIILIALMSKFHASVSNFNHNSHSCP